MATITFDTLRFASKLKSAGMFPEYAEAEVEALADIFEVSDDQDDIKLIQEDRIEALRAVQW